MPLSIKELETEYTGKTFFTSDRKTIEYLLQENLDALEEYALLVQDGRSILFTPEEAAASEIAQKQYCGYSNICHQNKVNNIQRELDSVVLNQEVEVMQERMEYVTYFQNRNLHIRNVTNQKMKQAQIKNERQTAAIKDCISCNQAAYRAIREKYNQSKDELDIWKDAVAAIRDRTGYANEIILDLLSGKRTSHVSGFPQSIIPKRKDTVIVDLLPREKGVFADTTRTFFIGEPTDKQAEIYGILLDALECGKQKLKPGVLAKDVFKEVRTALGPYGHYTFFPHHAGHGFGLGFYDAPYLLEEEEAVLEEGMVIAVEPGIYLPDQFGIRIEEDYLITKDGTEKLGEIPLAMEAFICG